MRVLILGSGAREHAVAWKLSRSAEVSALFAGPGNAGTAEFCANLPDVDPLRFPTVLSAVDRSSADCVFVGPETPLAAGVVDCLAGRGIPAFGPDKRAAQLESSKAFSKAFLVRNGIPTARATEFTDVGALEMFLAGRKGQRLVLKKSGLAAGKGVLESARADELLSFGRSALAEDRVLVEEFLEGWELSVFGVSDGKTHVVLPGCSDFKKAHDGDTGPNTGGMGSICPVPPAEGAVMRRVEQEIVEPTYAALMKEGLAYTGVLYFGLMITQAGPRVLEFNVRFGDPETQVLMPVLPFDLGGLLKACFKKELAAFASGINTSSPVGAALGVVIAGQGYPETSSNPAPVRLPAGPGPDHAHIFHASTYRETDGTLHAKGGRCFTVVGHAADLKAAADRAYALAERISFTGSWYRRDIGRKFMEARA
ncbi:MAG TPA: phosphoribosylamine--glycine ligase [Spirochaetia bacterium]|nr:phosphoribosylamine--glycine ligase [Spirochaetia bacterium]